MDTDMDYDALASAAETVARGFSEFARLLRQAGPAGQKSRPSRRDPRKPRGLVRAFNERATEAYTAADVAAQTGLAVEDVRAHLAVLANLGEAQRVERGVYRRR
jgi:hypothetical protein